jgi:hypothetical protein
LPFSFADEKLGYPNMNNFFWLGVEKGEEAVLLSVINVNPQILIFWLELKRRGGSSPLYNSHTI